MVGYWGLTISSECDKIFVVRMTVADGAKERNKVC